MSNKHRQPPRETRAPASITAVSTLGPNGLRHVDLTDNPIEVRAGEQITATPREDGTLTIGIAPRVGEPITAASIRALGIPARVGDAVPPSIANTPAPVLAAMWWNNIRRAWFTGPAGAPVMVDPQPPAPSFVLPDGRPVVVSVDSGRHYRAIPPAVKVSA